MLGDPFERCATCHQDCDLVEGQITAWSVVLHEASLDYLHQYADFLDVQTLPLAPVNVLIIILEVESSLDDLKLVV